MPDLGLGGHGPDEPLEQIESLRETRETANRHRTNRGGLIRPSAIGDAFLQGKVARYLSG